MKIGNLLDLIITNIYPTTMRQAIGIQVYVRWWRGGGGGGCLISSEMITIAIFYL